MTAAVNTSIGPGVPIESLSIVTPLGIRFWDLTLGLPIVEGLTVNLRLANSAWPVLTATLTASGVYAFFGLPGLRAAEYPTSSGFGPARTFSYVVTVQDQLGCYLPTVLVYTLDQTGAPVNGASGIQLAYLFSAPTRTPPPGIAAVTAYLIDQEANAPAAWAVVSLQVGSDPETWIGIANDTGSALVLAPYPVAQSLLLGSPPGSAQTSIGSDAWPLKVEVAYSPNLLSYPLAGAPDLVWPWTDTPNLKDILQAQQPATIWADPTTPVSQFQATLTLGQNLVLRSATAGSPAALSSSLNISQGASPP
jgi:hypothetical protein